MEEDKKADLSAVYMPYAGMVLILGSDRESIFKEE